MVADSLIWRMKNMVNLAYLYVSIHSLARKVNSLANNFMSSMTERRGFLSNVELRSTFIYQIIVKQFEDAKLSNIYVKVL